MSDLVERLRRSADEFVVAGAGPALHMAEAADEIERLRDRVAKLEAALRPFADRDTSSWLLGLLWNRANRGRLGNRRGPHVPLTKEQVRAAREALEEAK